MNIANKFNSFFTNVGKNRNNAISLPHDKSFKDYLKNRYNSKLTFQKHLTPWTTKYLLKSWNNMDQIECQSNLWKIIYQTGNNMLKWIIHSLLC